MSLASQARANALVTRSAGLLSLPPTYTTLRLILDDPQGTTQQMCGSIFASTAAFRSGE